MNSQDKNSVAMMWVGLAIILVLMAVAYLVGRQQKKCEVSDCSDSVETVRKLRVEVEELKNNLDIARSNTNAYTQDLEVKYNKLINYVKQIQQIKVDVATCNCVGINDQLDNYEDIMSSVSKIVNTCQTE